MGKDKGPTLKLGPIEIDLPSLGGLIQGGQRKAKGPVEVIIRELGKLLR
jgi:hypothetical protein